MLVGVGKGGREWDCRRGGVHGWWWRENKVGVRVAVMLGLAWEGEGEERKQWVTLRTPTRAPHKTCMLGSSWGVSGGGGRTPSCLLVTGLITCSYRSRAAVVECRALRAPCPTLRASSPT